MAKPAEGDVRRSRPRRGGPWTHEELDEVREDLVFDIERMERAIRTAEKGLEKLFDEGTEGAGRDPADVGSTNFERDQEMSLVQNARDMLDQAQNALRLWTRASTAGARCAASRSARTG
jgi:DnaK suppressor protein